MRVFLTGITSEQQYVRGVRSFRNIVMRAGDHRDEFASGRGDVSRRKACDAFLLSGLDALLLCDLDMWHPPYMLERLRAHDVDMVTGHYFAREAHPLHSVICEYGNGKYPYPPMQDIPSGLHRIGMTGMGNVLIKRNVIEAVAKHLPKGDDPFAIGAAPEVTGDHRSLGSDYRFFSVAQHLGFVLWLDGSVESEHAIIFWADRKLYEALRTYQLPERVKRTTAFHGLLLEEKGMDATTIQARVKLLEERYTDLVNQKQQFESSIELLEKQITSLHAVISEDKWILEQLAKEAERFPTVPEEQKKTS